MTIRFFPEFGDFRDNLAAVNIASRWAKEGQIEDAIKLLQLLKMHIHSIDDWQSNECLIPIIDGLIQDLTAVQNSHSNQPSEKHNGSINSHIFSLEKIMFFVNKIETTKALVVSGCVIAILVCLILLNIVENVPWDFVVNRMKSA